MRTGWTIRHLCQPLQGHIDSQVTIAFAKERQWAKAQQSDVAIMNLLINLAST